MSLHPLNLVGWNHFGGNSPSGRRFIVVRVAVKLRPPDDHPEYGQLIFQFYDNNRSDLDLTIALLRVASPRLKGYQGARKLNQLCKPNGAGSGPEPLGHHSLPVGLWP